MPVESTMMQYTRPSAERPKAARQRAQMVKGAASRFCVKAAASWAISTAWGTVTPKYAAC